MLELLRNRIKSALSAETAATMSTNGPGGIQAGFFPCQADHLTLYLLVPSSSDVLYNLESQSAVVVTTPGWQLEGQAHMLPLSEAPPTITLDRSPRAAGCLLVAVTFQRMHFNWSEGWGYRETIDCNGN